MRFDKDYYATLGLESKAGEDEIRRAYRRLALQWHPDRNAGNRGAEERFKEISEAYAVLIDPVKRREYDRARQGPAPGEFRRTRDDLFRDLFADPRASAVFEELAREFERLGMRVDRADFQRTLFGGRTVVMGGVFIITPLAPVLTLFRLARAALRSAQGNTARDDTASLPRSRGMLEGVLHTGRRWLGLAPDQATAMGSNAAGDLVLPLRLTRAEAELGGPKRVRLNRGGRRDDVLVTIPRGTRAGAMLRLRGKGAPRPEGTPGDVYLAVEITD